MLCENGTRKFLCTRNKVFNGAKKVAANSSLKTLYPFIHKEGLLRLGGRLQQTTLPYQRMHQIILPSNHHFTKLVVSSEQISLHHAGPQLLIASLRETFGIPRIRNSVKTVILQCLTCYRFKAQATQQLFGELPSTRVQYSRPFLTKGVDYSGPISVSLEPPRSKTITKGYIAIFVCFVTKAVQIEVVIILSTEAFLAALRLLLHVEGNQGPFVQTMVPTFKVLPMNFMQSTKCFNPHHRWQQYRTS